MEFHLARPVHQFTALGIKCLHVGYVVSQSRSWIDDIHSERMAELKISFVSSLPVAGWRGYRYSYLLIGISREILFDIFQLIGGGGLSLTCIRGRLS